MLQTELLKKTVANRERTDISGLSVGLGDEEQLFGAEHLFDDGLIADLYADVEKFDGYATGKGRSVQAQNERKKAVTRILHLMVRHEYLVDNILESEGIDLQQVVEMSQQHHVSTMFLEEKIQQFGFVQERILELAEAGKEMQYEFDSEKIKLQGKILQLKWRLRSYAPRQLLERIRSEQELKVEQRRLEQVEQIFYKGGYQLETICFKLVYDRKYCTETKEYVYNPKHNPLDEQLSNTLWWLTPSAHKKITDMIVDSYKAENKKLLAQHRADEKKQKHRKWKERNRKKELQADELRELIQAGRSEGLTQKEVSKLLDIPLPTVKYHCKKK